MSFIEQSERNVDRLMETSAGGGVGGFVGTGGTRIDTLFAGGFHPDYGEIDKLHKQNLKSRKKRDSEEYGGESPVGGYYEVDTELVLLAYDELDLHNQLAMEYSIENTPLSDTEWKSTGWEYDYDEIISYIEEKDFINTSETNMENVGVDIQYDDKPTYAGENFINQSEINWKIINRG